MAPLLSTTASQYLSGCVRLEARDHVRARLHPQSIDNFSNNNRLFVHRSLLARRKTHDAKATSTSKKRIICFGQQKVNKLLCLQAAFWMRAAGIKQKNYKTSFETAAKQFEKVSAKSQSANVRCFLACEQEPVNILWIMDESSYIGSQ